MRITQLLQTSNSNYLKVSIDFPCCFYQLPLSLSLRICLFFTKGKLCRRTKIKIYKTMMWTIFEVWDVVSSCWTLFVLLTTVKRLHENSWPKKHTYTTKLCAYEDLCHQTFFNNLNCKFLRFKFKCSNNFPFLITDQHYSFTFLKGWLY